MSVPRPPGRTPNRVVHVTKTVWPAPIGLSLTGYDAADRVVIVLPYKGKLPASRWLPQPVSSSERARVEREAGRI